MNEEELKNMIRVTIFEMFMDKTEIKHIVESKVDEVMYYIEHECVCANYKQKHRSELIKKLTGENKIFKYSGA